MNLTTITSEGNLLPVDLLARIAAGEAEGQQPADFGFEKSRRLSDEIAAAWSDARAYWDAFQRSLRRLPEEDPATTITREQWVLPLLRALGYEVTYQPRAAEVGGLTYAISHRAGDEEAGEDAPPIHIEGYNRPLDRRTSGRPRLSPHALVQEYLNGTEHLWGIITNGQQLRLLRDSSRTSRPTYLEWDLRAMMEGEKYAEFALLYRLLHRTRLPRGVEDAPGSLLEQYHQQALEAGGRVREGLREGVETALLALGRGLLQHPANDALREKLRAGELEPQGYYRQLLRMIYRLLFLMVAEERGLIGGSGEGRRIYYDFYSVTRLRGLAERSGIGRERHGDLWLGLLSTFRLLEDETGASHLGMTALDGDLFGPQAIPDLEGCRLSNRVLLTAIRALSLYRDSESGALRRVNYNALDVEELGSVYESLLDYRPVVRAIPNHFPTFEFAAGTERKTTGSYYTRPELVQELIKSALEPVLAERLREAGDDPAARERAILRMSVCDPACGSGHFLLAAARRLARELARVRSGEAQPGPEHFRPAVRDVIAHCIYGVDLNPLAVDLCKLALWIEGHHEGRPLSFLDSHIRWGNSLVGATRELVEQGIPDDAYKPVTGDVRAVATHFRARNRRERRALERQREEGAQQGTLDLYGAGSTLSKVVEAAERLEAMPENRVEAIRRKARAYECLRHSPELEREQRLYDLWTAAFFLPLTEIEDPTIPTTQELIRYRQTSSAHPQMVAAAHTLARRLGFFHWELEFPQIFGADGSGGFDVVLGNPPWEMLQLEEKEFFAGRIQEIAEAPNKAARERLIKELPQTAPALAREYAEALHEQDATNCFLRSSDRYPLTGVGRLNTYPLFAELAQSIVEQNGRVGVIVPTGIATDTI